jgi:nickel superoxide dismutase
MTFKEVNMWHKLFRLADRVFHFKQAKAHCDIPCGIYDPTPAQIDALTVVRMMDLMHELDEAEDKSKLSYHNSMSRYIAVKEEHAESLKNEVRVIWGDFMKGQKLEDYPQTHELVHKIMILGSAVRQTADRSKGLELIDAINEFAEIFWATKNVPTKKAKAPYAPGLEMVYPDL